MTAVRFVKSKDTQGIELMRASAIPGRQRDDNKEPSFIIVA